MPFTDEEIVRKVQRGEREEFLQLFDRHYARLERYALRQLHSAEAARDIASETFLRAYRSVDSFRVGEQISYSGYLFLICHRLILSERQRLRATPTTSLHAMDTAVVETLRTDTSASPLEIVLETERRAMVKAALLDLPADDQEIISLAFERDLSRRDIAQILSKPSVSAVTSHLHRAMQKLKTALLRQGYFAPMRETEQEAR